MTKSPLPLIRFCWLGFLTSTALAAPPRVIEATPDNGATNIEPGLKELRIVFDQPMSPGGFSIVGGGPTFPKLVGRGRWTNDRTLVWSWQLEPGHDYWLSINSDRFKNFRSQTGESATPYPISFKTKSASTTVPPAQSAGRQTANREALTHLQRAILEDYSYYDLRGIDWPKRFQELAPQLEAAPSARAFAEQAALLLAPAQDVHLWLQVEDQPIPTFVRRAPWNIAVNRLARLVPHWQQPNETIATGRFDDGIRYLCLRQCPGDTNRLEPAFEVLADATKAGTPLIVDLRANGGGSENSVQSFAGCFVEKPVAYAKHTTRFQGRLSAPVERRLEPTRNRPHFSGRVAVLIGQGTISSAESLAMMLKQAPPCTLIGDRTAGSSGNPKPVDLGNDVTAYVPSWRDLRLDGTCLEGEGYPPDIAVKTSPADFEQHDPVLERALQFLRTSR